MAEMKETLKPLGMQEVIRTYDQPSDAISFYSDLGQVTLSGHEIILQFYETIPGPPGPPSGQITKATTRLRATVMLSVQHAQNLGQLLIEKTGGAIKK